MPLFPNSVRVPVASVPHREKATSFEIARTEQRGYWVLACTPTRLTCTTTRSPPSSRRAHIIIVVGTAGALDA